MKQKLLKTMLLLSALVVGLGNVWADETTVTASKITSTSATWTGTGGETWNVSVTGGAVNQNVTGDYAQAGTRTDPSTSITFSTSDITGIITSIVVNCASYNALATVSATVDGSDFGTQSQSTPKWSNNTGGDVTFSGNASGDIVITMTNGSGGRAMYIKSITVTYSAVDVPTHTITYSATNGSISGVLYGTSTSVASGSSVAESGKVTLTATPSDGYMFSG